MSLGERIRDLRKRSGLTQEELAQQVCSTKNNISRYERDVSAPDFDTLRLLALTFSTTTDYLLGMPGALASVKTQISPAFLELTKEIAHFSEKKIEKLLDYAVLLQNSMKDE